MKKQISTIIGVLIILFIAGSVGASVFFLSQEDKKIIKDRFSVPDKDVFFLEEEVEVDFYCGDIVEYNGYYYKTIQIGEQCWFQENLKNTETGCLNREWNDEVSLVEQRACRAHSTEWGEEVLYQYGAAIEVDCPNEWMIPTEKDWEILENYLSAEDCKRDDEYNILSIDDEEDNFSCAPAGKVMKTEYWGGDNSSYFTALPTSLRYGEYGVLRSSSELIGAWWSSSFYLDNPNLAALFRLLWEGSLGISRGGAMENDAWGLSVRCILID